MNISDAKGAKVIGILESRICQLFILSIHLSTWTLRQATFLFFAASSFVTYLRPLRNAGMVNVAATQASSSWIKNPLSVIISSPA